MGDEKEADTPDAGIKFSLVKHKSKRVVLPGPYDSEEYVMDPSKMGKCFIFSHETFERHPELNRKSTKADVSRLYCRFRALNFEPDVFPDFTVREVDDKLKEAAKDNSDSCCFVCCILTHGSNGFLYAKDGSYPLDNVFTHFYGDVCESLIGKPKLFFIQACQGKKLDDGVPVVCKESFDNFCQFKIPSCADFLVAYSTFPGFVAFTNEKGSYFIQALCDALEKHAEEKDLLKILTIVNCQVASKFESRCKKKKMNEKKQMPLIMSTLTKDVNFYCRFIPNVIPSCARRKSF